MSDNDRMERAKRIRQMREGQRNGDEENDGPAEEPSDDVSDETSAGTDGDETGDDDTDDGTAAEPSPAEVVENVTGTSAAIPSSEDMEAAMEETMAQAETVETDDSDDGESASDEEPAAGPAGIAEQSASREAETRVLEFTLANEQYCLDIEYIEEIVKQEAITRVPNTPDFVEGVVDLRGQITTILNPKVAIGKDDQTAGDLIVVFDSEAFDDQGHIGWVVDDVRQVSPVTDDQVNDPPMGEDYINGVIDRDDDEQFVIWTTPNLALDEAE